MTEGTDVRRKSDQLLQEIHDKLIGDDLMPGAIPQIREDLQDLKNRLSKHEKDENLKFIGIFRKLRSLERTRWIVYGFGLAIPGLAWILEKWKEIK